MVAAPSRAAAAANRAALPNDFDLEHIAEETGAVGDEQRFGAESSLVETFIHLVKLVALPEDRAARHWTKEANAFLATAAPRWRPSIRRAIDPDGLWSDARRQVTRDLEIDGHAVPSLPQRCPFALEELVSREADPRDFAARLAAAVVALRAMPEA